MSKYHLSILELGQTQQREGQRRRSCVVTINQVDTDYCQTDSKCSLMSGSNVLLSYHLEHEGAHIFSDVFVCK
jgi:hypothetical protein